MVPEMADLSHEEKLKILQLPSLKAKKKKRGMDFITTYKILNRPISIRIDFSKTRVKKTMEQ